MYNIKPPQPNTYRARSSSTAPARYRASSSTSPNAAILQLQRRYGNHSVQQLLQAGLPAPIQAKLTVGAVGDAYEQEADRVAQAVVHRLAMPQAKTVQRMEQEEEEPIQMQPDLQRQSTQATDTVSPEVEQTIQQKRGTGHTLPDPLRGKMEQAFGSDFSNVTLHTDSESHGLNETLQARAFTTGQDIFFGQGEFNPHSTSGQELIAHELTHVIQQNGGQLQRKCADCEEELQQKHQPDTIQRRVRDNAVSCEGTRRTSPIFTRIGTQDPLGTIRAADSRAVDMLAQVIGSLEYAQAQVRGGQPAAWPTISDAIAISLQNRFGIDPGDSEIWTSDRHRTRGKQATVQLLLTRLRQIHRILDGGWIRYTCLSGDCDPGDWAFTYAGEYRIYLCRPFWNSGAVDNQALTLLHEAFHIYFDATDSGRHMWNAHCIEQFVADYHGVAVQPGFADSCT